MEVLQSRSVSPLLRFRERCSQSLERFSPNRMKRDDVSSLNETVNLKKQILSITFNNKSDTEGLDFKRFSGINLSGRKRAKEVKINVDADEESSKLNSDTIKEVLGSISSPKSFKRKNTNLLNEDRANGAVIDLTIDLCGTINDDDGQEPKEELVLKRRKLSISNS